MIYSTRTSPRKLIGNSLSILETTNSIIMDTTSPCFQLISTGLVPLLTVARSNIIYTIITFLFVLRSRQGSNGSLHSQHTRPPNWYSSIENRPLENSLGAAALAGAERRAADHRKRRTGVPLRGELAQCRYTSADKAGRARQPCWSHRWRHPSICNMSFEKTTLRSMSSILTF